MKNSLIVKQAIDRYKQVFTSYLHWIWPYVERYSESTEKALERMEPLINPLGILGTLSRHDYETFLGWQKKIEGMTEILKAIGLTSEEIGQIENEVKKELAYPW